MADQRKVRWDAIELLKNPNGWSTSGNSPLKSPFPYTDSWAMKSVLSIDGGGIKEYSSLVILQALMEEIGKIERAHNPKATSSIYSPALGPLDDEICAAPNSDGMPMAEYLPCHYFDFIAGTGTGGIIAMMLGRYRMSVGEAMDKYRDLCAGGATVVKQKLILPPPKHERWKPVFSRSHKASRYPKARTMELVPAWPSPNEDEGDLQLDPERCRTIVWGLDSQLQPSRSDANSDSPRNVDDIILRPVGAEPSGESDYDAKNFYSNPSRTVLVVLKELKKLKELEQFRKTRSLPDHSLPENDGIDLLSIGGACNPVDSSANMSQHMRSIQIQRVHEELSRRPAKFNLNHYRRLDVLDPDLQDIGADDWKSEESDHPTLHRIQRATKTHLQHADAAKVLEDLATRLVHKRRLRAATCRWERWALGVVYRCPVLHCGDWNERFDGRVGFWVHMLGVHGARWHEGYGGALERDALERGYHEYEALGRTREGSVDKEIYVNLEERIAAAKEKRERGLRRLAKKMVVRPVMEGWIRELRGDV